MRNGDVPDDAQSATASAFLSDRDVAQQLGCGVEKVRSLMRSGQIPGEQYGKCWKVPAPLWQRYLLGEWKREAA